MNRRFGIGLGVLAAIVIAIGAVLAFTGGDSGSASMTDADAFSSCLADHGVEMPAAGSMPGGAPPMGAQPPSGGSPPTEDPSAAGDVPQMPSGAIPGAPDADMQQALEDCSKYAPDGAPSGFPGNSQDGSG